MAEYIEREHLANLLTEEIAIYGEKNSSTNPISYGTAMGLKTALRYVNGVGAADVVEVRHGKWINRKLIVFDSELEFGYKCSECNTTWDTPTNYCPNCGAKMDGKGEGE